MKFANFSEYLTKLEKTSSRIEITKILSDLFSELTTTDIKEATYLLSGGLAPSYEGVIFNVAEKMMVRSVADSVNKSPEEIQKDLKKTGDLGVVAAESAKSRKSKDLSIKEVFNILLEISKEAGEGSQERRIQLISSVLKDLDAQSTKFVVRMILGRLRLGFSEKTVLDALSWMETGGKSKSGALLKAYEVVPDIGTLAIKVKEKGIDAATKHISPVLGVPVQPMLCQRLKSPSEMIKKMGEVAVEPKFDGLRVLIHFSRSKKLVRAFTRNLKDISTMFPELNKIGDHVNADEIILDSEAVGMDPELIKLVDFQTTMQRRRKHEIEELQSKIPITFQVFDILYLDGKSLMPTPYKLRRETLTKVIKGKGLLKVDDYTVTTDPAVITSLHKELRSDGLEGVIVKKLDSEYVPGRLGWRWVKMKEAEEATGKLADTVDAVIMGFTSGKGRRSGFGVGQFLVGVLDGDIIKTITKVGTGLTDEQFKLLNTKLQSIKVAEKPKEYEVSKALEPDVWVSPKIVVELAADDITVSPNHTAGLALRFPRLVQFREDKGVAEATSLKEVKKLFNLQKK